MGLLTFGIIIGYCCIKKKKSGKNEEVTPRNVEATHGNAEEYTSAPIMRGNQAIVSDEVATVENPERYSLDPTMNQARINSDMILNNQAELLSYNGEHEIERSNFEIGRKLGGGSFGGGFEGIIDDPKQPRQKMKVAIKTVNNPRDESQVY